MAGYPKEFIDRVRDTANVVDIIGQYTELKASGGQYMGRCPFPDHPEKTPSFSVSETKQVYHCFGCKKSGNVFTFLESFSGMNFPEAVEYLARRYSLPIPAPENRNPDQVEESRRTKDLALRINAFAAAFFEKTLRELPDQHPANLYRLRRGLNDGLCKEYGLGYARDNWEDLTNALQRANLPLGLAERLGLVRSRSEGRSGHYDFFRDRLMFPIRSTSGDVIGFGGRIVGDGQPKYLNSPESPLFSKGKSLYLMDRAARHLRTQDEVIVAEGYMDAIALSQAGFSNAVAVLGTALTAEHARLLRRHCKKVTLLFDADRAGQQAARASLPVLLREGLFVHAVSIPDGKDPDEFLSSSPDAAQVMRDRVQNAPEMFTVLLQDRLRTYTGASSDKVKVLDDLGEVLRSVSDRRLLGLYIRELAERLQVTPSWVQKSLAQPADGSRVSPPTAPTQPRATVSPRTGADDVPTKKIVIEKNARKAEVLLLNLALKSPECLVEAQLRGVASHMQSLGLRQALETADRFYRQHPERFDRVTASLAEIVEPMHIVLRHLEPSFAQMGPAEDKKLLQDCIQNIQEFHLKRQASDLVLQLKQPSAPQDLEQFMNIVKARKGLKRQPET